MGDNVFLLDVAQKTHDLSNDTVKILVCDSSIDICYSNPRADKTICKWCKNYRKNLIKKLSKDIEILNYQDFYPHTNKSIVDSLKFDYSSVEDIKKLTYKNVKIGYGAFSSYVSLTRNLYPKIDDEFKNYFNRYIKAECALIELLGNVLNQKKPNIIHVYNGRHFETRPIFDLAVSLGYTVRCYENVRFSKKKVHYYYYENNLPHNIKSIGDTVKQVWDSADLPQEKKIMIGNSFFINRRTAVFAGDRIYTREQKQGMLPDGFDKSKRNIAVFPSSEDEFASIDNEYDDNNIFISQYQGVMEILEYFKNNADFHFYLRIHPNLKNIKYKYHISLLELGRLYKNVTVISADDKICSYTLLDNVEKALVFGTTMGIEACFWGKPVILLRNAFFNYLNVCYRPQSREEVFSLINANDLPAKDKTDALKYGFYRMYDRNHKSTHTDFNSKYKWFRLITKHITSFVNRKIRKNLEKLDKKGLYKGIKIPITED
jgi:hypothetical protein